ncbi:MAE_28990/MAE_18760 family HEPN-like nuclease [Lacrimispora saccharolytica]|uniref:MAE-28990/MAE-18760-like HEPN domain-containing protein n=1 Tax=Lacrimispora saccharolytica (strain ATCC 35040 / DSM 2544 / NRCC 2533 / WM1) TaxID=610130 RepID=D9R1M8_LACSW|nr:MAE_28990/MAE_18760 family HEPN-like nuclease [Lacrimispora saccharolytica]ADL06551.1 hypothetical protein Closa_4041 [[Clostridium] saccharolyticum WM1]QRV19370.1 hypothetical protein I6K70_18275 [Lacrimispora saccharolytica]
MSFIDEINNDINWRMSELASLKTIPLRYRLPTEHKQLLIKYSIPSMYALWEGFVKRAFGLYIKEINSLAIPINDVDINLLTHALSSIDKLKLENPRTNYKTKKEFISLYQNTICQPLVITDKLPTKSNIDFSVMNEILQYFNLEQLPDSFKTGLGKFLKFRNSISHGDDSIPITVKDIEFFSKLIIDLMTEILLIIETGYTHQTYLKTAL